MGSTWRGWTNAEDHQDDEEALSEAWPAAWDLVVAAIAHNSERAIRRDQAAQKSLAESGIKVRR